MRRSIHARRTFSLCPPAFYTAILGLSLLALAACDTAVRVDMAITQNPNLIGSVYIPAIEHILAGLVVLTGGVLLIDYVQKTGTESG